MPGRCAEKKERAKEPVIREIVYLNAALKSRKSRNVMNMRSTCTCLLRWKNERAKEPVIREILYMYAALKSRKNRNFIRRKWENHYFASS